MQEQVILPKPDPPSQNIHSKDPPSILLKGPTIQTKNKFSWHLQNTSQLKSFFVGTISAHIYFLKIMFIIVFLGKAECMET